MAFFAEIGFCSSGSSSSSSSSSLSDEETMYRKDKRNGQGGPAGLCFVSTKSRRRNKEDKDDGSNSSSGDEVTPEQAEILEMLEQNSRELKAQDKMLEKAAKKLQKLKAQLAEALEENERMQLVDRDATIRKLEKAVVVPSLDCDTCAAQIVILEDLRKEMLSLQNDNNRLREVVSWVYARQPQLEMIIESTKRAEGATSGVGFGECSISGEMSAPIKVKTAPTQPGETVDGVYHEPPKAAPKKQSWTPKPSKAKLDKIVEEELKPKGKKPVRRLEPPKATPPKPKSRPNPDRGMEDVWIMDSGCSRHMTGHRKWFSSLNPVSTKEYITFGDNGQGKVMGVGSVLLSAKLSLREVAFVQNLGFNLVSVSQLLDEGFEVRFKKEAKQVVETCEVSFDETMPCTTPAFELSGDDEEGTPIFEDEEGFKLQQMDVKYAFPNGFIEEEVYVRQPPGFESARFPDRVHKLRKALYGPKQAPRACFAEQMSREYEMSLMGELQFFLGLQIKQGLEGTFVHQAKYSRDILKKFNMGDSKPMTTPMSTNTALDADEDGEAVDQKEFRGMIGSLRTRRRPGRTFGSRSASVRATRLLLGLLTVKR
ncbi:hypothetical protein U9M48_000510 [Paspalum notatum var. saurae]|uniref:Uncharacterized protein n=1 Tax=Paspalum notatum var. saurae TaxID=547442 RepID=A0AAQ3PMJ3_PASNO